METNQDDLKAHLLATSDAFRGLSDQHCQYHKDLEALEAKVYLSDDEQAEEHRLKKEKLRVKDQINQILAGYRAQKVA